MLKMERVTCPCFDEKYGSDHSWITVEMKDIDTPKYPCPWCREWHRFDEHTVIEHVI